MRSARWRVLAAVFCALLVLALPDAARAAERKVKDLPPEYQFWLASVELLITKLETKSFLALEKDYQRDAFIERFWAERDPYPDSERNEMREHWKARAEEAARLFGDLTEDRSRILLLNGIPNARFPFRCADLFPGEVWYYARAETIGTEIAVLFSQRGGLGRYHIWYPVDGLRDLFRFPPPNPSITDLVTTCGMETGDAIRAAISIAVALGKLGFTATMADMQMVDDSPSGEWVATFNSYSTDLPDDVATFDADVGIDFPGRHKSRTVVQGLVSVAAGDIAGAQLAGLASYNLLLTGEVIREGKLFDSFRYSFDFPPTDDPTTLLPLLFERYLRPGDYQLVVKVEDLNSKSFHRHEQLLSVPRVEAVLTRQTRDPETARILEEANAAISSGETTLRLVPPAEDLVTGKMRIETLSTGPDLDQVTFLLDGQPVLTKRNPPFSVELDLGSLPRMRTLAVVGTDADGNEVARDQVELNTGSNRFAVRLIEPRRGKTYSSSLRAEAEVEVPEDKAVASVEFYLNETKVATLYQPPYVQPILLPAEQLAYVRAVAYLPDGNSTEDLVFVNAPDYLEEVEVQFVELYVAVLDRNKRPVEGLGEDDFKIEEDGIAQTPTRFDRVSNLPIHAGILLDVSASMEDSLEMAQNAALQFLQQTITAKDRATLVTFNDHPNLASKFTNEIEVLAAGLAGLKAERGTALYDSLIFALYYFNGIKGQRALIVLSDGRDEHSSFSYENTVQYARRAGVSIYTIGLGLGRGPGEAKRKLSKLADETGGRSFFIDDAGELAVIYESIQRELRSRYYIAYQSTNASTSEDFRTIEVEVAGRALEAKTLRGYYP